MKILFWDSESSALEEFLGQCQDLVDIVGTSELSDLEEMIDEDEEIEAVLFDYDANTKGIEKEIKKIRKNFSEIKIILISNLLTSKQLAKHQSSKVGGDVYFRTPIHADLITSFFESLFEIKILKKNIPKTSLRQISEDHQTSEIDVSELNSEEGELDDEVLSLLLQGKGINKLEVASESPNETLASEVLEKLEDLELTELDDLSLDPAEEIEDQEIEDEDNIVIEVVEDSEPLLPDEDDLTFPDIGELAKRLDETIEEPDMSGIDENELSLDSLDELELGEETDLSLSSTQEEGLDLDLSDSPDLDFDSEDEIVQTIEEDNGLELGDLGDELELGSDEDIDLTIDTTGEGDLDLDNMDALSLEEDQVENQIEDMEELSLGDDLSLEDDLSLGEELSLGEDLSLDEGLDLGGESLELSDDLSDLESLDNSEDLEINDEMNLTEDLKNDVDLEELNLDLGEDIEVAEDDLDLFMKAEEDQELEDNEKINFASADEQLSDKIEDQSLEFNVSMLDNGEDQDLSENAEFVENQEDSLSSEELFNEAGDFNEPTTETVFSEDAQDKLSEIDDYLSEDEGLENEDYSEDVSLPKQNEISQFEQISETQTNIPSDYGDVSRHNHEELLRLGETIKNLREDRDSLMDKISSIEERKNNEVKDTTSIKAELDEKKIELAIIKKRYVTQIEEYKHQLELSQSKKEILEEKNKQIEKEFEDLNRKIRIDINKVRSRERELESKLELLRGDAEIQIRNRDQKILELKRKIDTLEFDLDSMQSQGKKIVNNKYQLEEKMEKVIQTLRGAIGELEDETILTRAIDIKKNLDV